MPDTAYQRLMTAYQNTTAERATLARHVRALSTAGAVLRRRVGRCKACRGTGTMEDGPAGATYSAPCTFCANGVPLDAAAWDDVVEDARAATDLVP